MTETRPRPSNHEIREAIVDDLWAEGIFFPIGTVEAWQEDLLRMGFTEGDVMVRFANVTKLAARKRLRLEEALALTCDELVLSVLVKRWCADPPLWKDEDELELDSRVLAESIAVVANAGGGEMLDKAVLVAAGRLAARHDQRDIVYELAPAMRLAQAKSANTGEPIEKLFGPTLEQVLATGSFRSRGEAFPLEWSRPKGSEPVDGPGGAA